jgi:hypothetical protein
MSDMVLLRPEIVVRNSFLEEALGPRQFCWWIQAVS